MDLGVVAHPDLVDIVGIEFFEVLCAVLAYLLDYKIFQEPKGAGFA